MVALAHDIPYQRGEDRRELELRWRLDPSVSLDIGDKTLRRVAHALREENLNELPPALRDLAKKLGADDFRE